MDRVPFLVADEEDTTDIETRVAEYHERIMEQPRALPTGVDPTLIDLCLQVTGSFEGEGYGQVTGNFDGQGLSLGILQQCLGQGSLQPLLVEYAASEEGKNLIAGWGAQPREEFLDILKSNRGTQVSWAGRALGSGNKARGAWAIRFKSLATSPGYVALQQRQAQGIFTRAVAYADDYKLSIQRAVALFFDIVVQNGSIKDSHKGRINALIKAQGTNPGEGKILEAIARGRAEFSLPRWQSDVASRKLCVARWGSAPFVWNGRHFSGAVHGSMRNLAREYRPADGPIRPK